MLRLICPALLCLLATACGDEDGGKGNLLIAWSFLDSRTCADSGAERVLVRPRGEAAALLNAACSSGYGGSAAKVSLEAGSHRLVVEGMSAQATPLYSGHLDLEIAADEQVSRQVKLAFVGGR